MPWSDLAEGEARLHQVALDRARVSDDHVWRPHVFEGMFGQRSMMEGKLSPIGFLQVFWTSLPWFARAFTTVVPDSYVAEDLNSDGYSAATVSCPCGEAHEVEIGTVVSADCERAFAWFGESVVVANKQKLMETTAD